MKVKQISTVVMQGIENRYKRPLLTAPSGSAKTKKNKVPTFILYLAPAIQNNFKVNVCPKASQGCIKSCLFTAGRAKFISTINKARTEKTDFMLFDPTKFYRKLAAEISFNYTVAFNEKIAFRLNGTSDINHYKQLVRYANFDINNLPNNVIFYEYTKNLTQAFNWLKNYPRINVTFSKSENNWDDCKTALNSGINVAVVFNQVPHTYKGYKVINGDVSDERFNDQKGVIVGLKAKGEAKNDRTGFVVHV
jgi:hypothetical protein